ncbi:hypothetical protein B0H13DRAFT_1919932 [Mycena leptocephala]|nr:hypothetical protein B0H13DRAFT_1919932 [Mycena leptocephala]
MSETVRTKKRTDSARNNQSLEAEAVAVGASFDSVGGSIEEHSRIVAGRPRARSLPGELVSDIDLAAKWGLPVDEVQESMGRRVTRSTRSTKPERQEVPSRDTSAAMRQEVSDPVSISDASAATRSAMSCLAISKPLTARKLCARRSPAPSKPLTPRRQHCSRATYARNPKFSPQKGTSMGTTTGKLEDHLEFFYGSFSDGIEQAETHAVLEPVFSWSNEWTTVHKAGRRVEAGKNFTNSTGHCTKTVLPRMDMSDNEDVMELMSDEDIPEDADLQAVLLASWKDSRASCLGGNGGRVLQNHCGAVIVEMTATEMRSGRAARSRSPSPVPSSTPAIGYIVW